MMKRECARNQDQVINNCKVQWLSVFHHKLFPSLQNNKTWGTIWSLLTWFKKMDGLVGSWECLLYCSQSHCSEVHLFWSLCELLSKNDKSLSHFRLHCARPYMKFLLEVKKTSHLCIGIDKTAKPISAEIRKAELLWLQVFGNVLPSENFRLPEEQNLNTSVNKNISSQTSLHFPSMSPGGWGNRASKHTGEILLLLLAVSISEYYILHHLPGCTAGRPSTGSPRAVDSV